MKATTRRRDPVAAREALIDAGERTFRSFGYFATNSNAIAREAGYAPGSFYTHFEDKLDLFLVVYQRWARRRWEDIRAATKSGSRKTVLALIVSTLLAQHRDSGAFRDSLRALDVLEPRVRAARNSERVDQLEFMAQIAEALGTPIVPMERRVVALLTMERLIEALADAEAEVLGASEAKVRRQLVGALEWLLFVDGSTEHGKAASKTLRAPGENGRRIARRETP